MWKRIDYQDNQHTLDTLAAKPLNLLALIDEESNFPKVCALVLPCSKTIKLVLTRFTFFVFRAQTPPCWKKSISSTGKAAFTSRPKATTRPSLGSSTLPESSTTTLKVL